MRNIALRSAAGRVGLGRLELLPLDVDGHATREVTKAADMVVVKMAERHRHDVAGVDAHEREGVLEGIPGSRQLELGRPAAPEPVVEGAIADERAVEAGVEQHEAVRDLEEESGNGLAEEDAALGLGNQGHRGPARKVLPAERQRKHAQDAAFHETQYVERVGEGQARTRRRVSSRRPWSH